MDEGMAYRIRTLRQERDLTLEQVADVVGVGKSTVRKWETGMIANMKRDKIASLAKALGTTPAYLMGWNEDVSEDNSPSEQLLTEAEQKMLELFRQIPVERQESALEVLEAVLKMQKTL